ncbi:MAG: ABC transporter ATP-binding protein [Pseudomonadota bacterium]
MRKFSPPWSVKALPPETAPPAVSVAHAVRKFGHFTAVDDVSFDIGRGEIFGLLGPNGAGKSTMIRMMCGLLRPTSGRVTILDSDTARQSRRIRSRIGYMSQEFSLYEDLTVIENIRLFGGLYGLAGEGLSDRSAKVLEMSGLTENADRTTKNLSRGHRQRLALGCALLHEPELLFLDEPTSGVDPLTRRRFWKNIRELAEKGVTVLVTTHNMEEASECGRLALMYTGRIIAMDTPDDLLAKKMPWSVLKVQAQPLMKALSVLRTSSLTRDAALFGNAIHVFVESGEPPLEPLKDLMGKEGITVSGVSATRPSLEDVFVSLIEEEGRKGSSR